MRLLAAAGLLELLLGWAGAAGLLSSNSQPGPSALPHLHPLRVGPRPPPSSSRMLPCINCDEALTLKQVRSSFSVFPDDHPMCPCCLVKKSIENEKKDIAASGSSRSIEIRGGAETSYPPQGVEMVRRDKSKGAEVEAEVAAVAKAKAEAEVAEEQEVSTAKAAADRVDAPRAWSAGRRARIAN